MNIKCEGIFIKGKKYIFLRTLYIFIVCVGCVYYDAVIISKSDHLHLITNIIQFYILTCIRHIKIN